MKRVGIGQISFDIDGVLANFTRGFTKLGNKLFGTPVGSESNQQSWNFEEFPELQLTKERIDAMWRIAWDDPWFWAMLDPLNTSVMSQINRISNRIFITNRLGIDAKKQSEYFLWKWGIDIPKVFLASDKVPVAIRQGVVAHIDDNMANCVALKTALPDAYIAMLWTSYNQRHHAEWTALGGPIVLSVEQFIEEVKHRNLALYNKF